MVFVSTEEEMDSMLVYATDLNMEAARAGGFSVHQLGQKEQMNCQS